MYNSSTYISGSYAFGSFKKSLSDFDSGLFFLNELQDLPDDFTVYHS